MKQKSVKLDSDLKTRHYDLANVTDGKEALQKEQKLDKLEDGMAILVHMYSS